MFDWNQTNTAITISIPIPYRVDKKKVDYIITDLYVKLNIIEMKKIYFIDLAKHVDSSIGKMIIEDNKILFVLPKKEEGLWKELEFKGSKEEVKQRRKEAEDVYYEKIKKDNTLNSVFIDCSKLEYVSSAGLRVLLIMQNDCEDGVIMKSCNETVIGDLSNTDIKIL